MEKSRTEKPNTDHDLDIGQDAMRALSQRVADLAVKHLSTLGDQPAQRALGRHDADLQVAGGALENATAPETATDVDALLGFLEQRVFPYHAREPHPHFMGYIPSSPTFPAVMGDWLATAYNFFAGVWPVASGPNEIELIVLEWFRQWLGLPEGTSGLLTSGGSGATMTAVVAARHDADPDGEHTGRLTLYTSEQAHSSVQRAAWIAGIPRANVRAVDTDDDFRLQVAALGEAIAHDRAAGLHPFLVVASAGTTNTGAIDPLDDVAALCAREQLWMHVDAAFGGFAALIEQGAAQMRGIERADSVTLDPHKWLFVPFECGCLLAREPRKLEDAFSVHPEYLTDVRARDREVNFADLGEQLTRGSHALKVWLCVRYFGLARIRAAIDAGIRRAEYAETLIKADERLEVLSPAQFGIVCFRARPLAGESAADTDARNERVNSRVNATGRFLMSSTKLRGKFSLRLCTQVHRMTGADIDEVFAAIHDAMSAR